ncbi:MAG: metallophosphoesterase [Bacteroidota bacterium]
MTKSFVKASHLLGISILFIVLSIDVFSQKVPAVHSNIKGRGTYQVQIKGKSIPQDPEQPGISLSQLRGNATGNKNGILLDFGLPGLKGRVYYGFVPYGDSKHPHPVYFKSPAEIIGGKALINIIQLKGRYDMIKWEKTGRGTVGYRIVNEEGQMLYDGLLSFTYAGNFKPAPTLVEGPYVNLLSHEGATLSFDLTERVEASVEINGQIFSSEKADHHEIAVSGLSPSTSYPYTVSYGDFSQSYELTTAPAPGTRSEFVFAYASDSRSGQGGGERDIYGTNFYIMKKIMALAKQQGASFFQFSGDLIDGYLTSYDATLLQYANWKRAVQPFWHYFPIYVSMGNHEALNYSFRGGSAREVFIIDRFPYDTESSEAAFAQSFVLPTNGPESEDGASYDPDEKNIDFPSYKENVFYYTYDNVAVVVMNSDYWYAPNHITIPHTGGGLHGYIMDEQLAWFAETMETLEADANIDHIFITQHTPFFPNGGHVGDDMWYRGNNQPRPYVAGKPLEKGIIERRDQLLDIIVNQSTKAIAILTGDEHNYARTKIFSETNIYPDGWNKDKVELSRTIYQINNGAAGAPYYAQEETPWTPHVSGFTTQNALVLFTVNGSSVKMQVLNPDTLEEVDELILRE